MQSLADRFAEAFAEHLHERIRKEFWGYKADEQLSNEELIKENTSVFALHRVTLLALSTLKKQCCLTG